MITTGFNDSRIKHSLDAVEKYDHRKPAKHRAEMHLIQKAIKSLANVRSILDAPCGLGRASIMLAKQGFQVNGIDAGTQAVLKSRFEAGINNVSCQFDQADLREIPFYDNQFDAVLCFRFFHHLSTGSAKNHIISELCRVSKDYVLISYFSPWSVTSFKRKLETLFKKKASRQKTTTLCELKTYFDIHNYTLEHDFAQQRGIHTLHLAVFKKGH